MTGCLPAGVSLAPCSTPWHELYYKKEARMKTIQVRLSDQEEAGLQERVRLTGLSISSLVRESLFPGSEAKLAERPASAGQVHELARQVAALSEAVGRLSMARENGAAPEGVFEVVLEPGSAAGGAARAGETGARTCAPAVDFPELMALLQEQKCSPFGLDLHFVQATLMAVFSLARGSFSTYPEEWEPFKMEARRRAFARKSEEPCRTKN
jgi:hypothetical protein